MWWTGPWLTAALLGWAWGGTESDDDAQPDGWGAWETVTAVTMTALVALAVVAVASPKSVAGEYLRVVRDLVFGVLAFLVQSTAPIISLIRGVLPW